MKTYKRKSRRSKVAVATAIMALAATGSAAAAFQALPPGDQVNNDALAGIDPAKPVDIANSPANSDVTGGSLTGGVNVPWAVFRQKTTGADQIFSRSFAGGKWTTRGSGTVGGASDTVRPFSGSLNFDQGQDGEAPSIDFAGAGRTVPWATWYEHTTAFAGKEQIFASRFDSTSGKWVFAGQTRGTGSGTVPVPSLNINTNQDAENPVVAGGSAADPTKPGPWVAWQEVDANGGTPSDQIFVSKPIGPGTTTCPAGTKPSGGSPIGGFCFQQVGIERVNTNADPSLNIDPVREGIEPDIAFTGANDSVPWVVWYETGTGSVGNNNDQVFAAKGVAPDGTQTGTVDGGFNWISVGGNGGTGKLDVAGHNPCLASLSAEKGCTLNADPTASAVDPSVAAGTMTPGNPTVPWVAWEEASGGHERIFVSRLVNGAFKLANGGQPLPTVLNGIDAKRPDITFSGNTPYVSWHEGSTVVTGHFSTPDSFVIDNGAVAVERRGHGARADLVRVHCGPVQPGWGSLPGCSGGDAVLPVLGWRRGSREAVRERLPARHPGDRRGDGRDHVGRDAERLGQSSGSSREGLVPVRGDDGVRSDHCGAEDRRQHLGGWVHR